MEILANSFQNEILYEIKTKAFVSLKIWKKHKIFQRNLSSKNKARIKKSFMEVWKKKTIFSTILTRFCLINENFLKKIALCHLKRTSFLKNQIFLLKNSKNNKICLKYFGILKYYRDIQHKKQKSILKLSGL